MGILGIFGYTKIIELTAQNFQHFVNKNPYLLVNFYSPFCKYCQRFAPEYEKTAKQIYKSGNPVTVAQINASQETTIADQQGIERYPTIKFFKHSVPCRYDGPQESSKILQWMNKHISK